MNAGKVIPLRFLISAFKTQAKNINFRAEGGKTKTKEGAEHEHSRKPVP